MKTLNLLLAFLIFAALPARAAYLNNTVSQGSTTSGQQGPIVQAAVTTSAPTYSNGQTNPLNVTTNGALRTDATTIANGVAVAAGNGTTNTGTQRVTISSDSTGQLALAAGSAVVGVVGNAQGSTTSGQSGPLMQGAVTTAAPSYSTAQTSPLSLTLTGALRTNDSDAFINFTPAGTQAALPIKATPQTFWRTSFSKVVAANGVDTTYWSLLQTGSGMAISQASGTMIITTGTTANSETAIRSLVGWTDSFNLRVASQLSQRIANNNFYVELVDVIGDSLSYTINSATSVTVTISGTTWTTAANAGQTAYIGFITGAAGIPMKATIASVSGSAVTFTVAGWPASGSGTCSVFGWNYHHILYTSTTATNANYDAQRDGWPTGDTVATINTTAAPGHMAQLFSDDGTAYFTDSLVATTLTPVVSVRATRFDHIPTTTSKLYLQIRALNGTSAPATTTTWTLFFAGVEDFAPQPVSIMAAKLNGAAAPNVAVTNVPAVTVNSGTVTTVSTVTSVTTLANGQTAHSAASTGSPVRVGGRVITTPDVTLVQGDASDLAVTSGQQLITKPFGSQENDWFYVSPAGGTITNTTTPVSIAPARAASTHNYISQITVSADALGTATELAVRDVALTCSSQTIAANTLTTATNHGLSIGDVVIASASTVTGLTAGTTYYVLTVPSATTLTFSATPGGSTLTISGTGVTATLNHYLWRQKLQTAGVPQPLQFMFDTPLRGGTAVAEEVVTLTASTGGVFFSCSGYQSF